MPLITPDGRIFTEREAAMFMTKELYAPIRPATLQLKRTRGTGPKFSKVFGRVEYVEADLREYVGVQRKSKFRSTLEAGLHRSNTA